MWVNGAWVKRYCVLCSKTYNTLHSCHNFPADSRQAARDARICETSLLQSYKCLNSLRPSDTYMHNQPRPSFIQIMACCLFDPKALSEAMLYYCQFKKFSQIVFKIQLFSFKKMHLKMSSAKWWPFCLSLKVLMPAKEPWRIWEKSLTKVQ